jgi:hypothetical protein
LNLPERLVSSYCYTLSVEGDEQPLRSSNCDASGAAIEHRRKMLLGLVSTRLPATPYCVIDPSGDIDAEPLGAWDWSRGQPQPVWLAGE